MMVKLPRTWILTSILYLVLLFDIAELQDIKFPKSKYEKAKTTIKVDKGMIQKFIIYYFYFNRNFRRNSPYLKYNKIQELNIFN